MAHKKTRHIRPLHQELKTARGRRNTSQKWLMRQLNDVYVQKAKEEGYRSRACYKLLEIDDKHRLLRPGQHILDLGCAPGGWTQVVRERLKLKDCQTITGSLHDEKCINTVPQNLSPVLGVDLLPMEPVPEVNFIQGDFLSPEFTRSVNQLYPDQKFDVILSDMAPKTLGHPATDHLKIMGLAEAVFDYSRHILAPDGHILIKIFQGAEDHAFLKQIRCHFKKGLFVKPVASRKGSSEIYVLGKSFK